MKDTQISEITEISSISRQVSTRASSDGENDNLNRDPRLLQQENIIKMVREKDLDSVQNFGGSQGIAEALDTDLEKGISGHEQDLSCRSIARTLSITQTTTLGFFQFLPKSCNNYTNLLLLVSVVLSLGFGIKEKGMRTGWYEGAIIILAIIVVVVAHSIREYRLKHSKKMSRRQRPLEIQQMRVDVIRGGDLKKVLTCDVLLGDIVCLEKGNFVPPDGLFISGELIIEVDGDLESIINDHNPFLFYGAKVTNGTGRMIVTSESMDTTLLGDLLNQVAYALDKTPLPAQLDKVNTGTQITGLSISILILVVLFLRFMLHKENVHSNLPDLKKPTASKEIMDAILKNVMKLNRKNGLIASLSTLLVGVTEGIPLVITLIIYYWNKKMLSDKASTQDPLACLTMSSITTICIDKNDWPLDEREIEVLKNAGVNITMFSEDKVSVPQEAIQSLPNLENRLVLEGEEFRNYTDKERMDKVEKIGLMGSSLPSDKLLLVQYLKKRGHIVAMVGVKTNEIPALKEADVGIAITRSTEMARESSDIIIKDCNLSSFFTIISCERCTYDNIRKYIQLELTKNIAGLLITSITTMFCGNSPITAIQLLWANFVVALLGGFSLLIEPNTEKLMEKPPLSQTEPLITKAMWRNLVIQALFQAAILLTLQFKGQTILDISKKVNKTIIFNSFVLCQVFNHLNSSGLEKKNVLKHIHRNPFLVAVVVTLVLQLTFIEIAHILGNARLNWVHWFVCLLVGMVSWVNDLVKKCTYALWKWLTGRAGSHRATITFRPSTPSEPTCNLELPLTHS